MTCYSSSGIAILRRRSSCLSSLSIIESPTPNRTGRGVVTNSWGVAATSWSAASLSWRDAVLLVCWDTLVLNQMQIAVKIARSVTIAMNISKLDNGLENIGLYR